MFERLAERARRLAEARAAERRRALKQEMEAALPPGIRVEVSEEGVRLSGRGLVRRFVLDARLRGLATELRR